MDNISEGLESIKFIIKTSICYDIFDTITINIVNRDTLKLNIQGDTLICDGDSASILATLTDGLQPYQFSWNNGVNSYSQTLLPSDSTQTYVFNATDVCNDSETDSIIIKKYIKTIAVRSDTAVCEGSSVLLYGFGTGGELVWDNLIGDSVLVNPITTTQYIASVSDVCGTIKDSVLISVDQIPYFSLGMDTIVCEQNPIIIGIPSNPDYQYLWSNGLPTSSILTDSPNAYILSVTNGTCSYLDTIVVGAGFCDWWIPNSFSPGKDGINDSFKPVGAPLENYEMVIYDRWGEVIFTTLIWTIGWDGTYLNQNVESGIYFYQIWGNSLGTNEKVLLKFDRVYLYK
jgi:gliding motility-associated-like protein